MEKFKATLKKRLAVALLYNAVILILLVFGVFFMSKGSSDYIRGYVSGYNLGFCVGIQFVTIYLMVRYYKAIRNEEKLKALYIYENDERNKFIQTKIGGLGINIAIAGLAIGTIVSGYFNETVFFTLSAAMIFTALVKGILKIVYSNKF